MLKRQHVSECLHSKSFGHLQYSGKSIGCQLRTGSRQPREQEKIDLIASEVTIMLYLTQPAQPRSHAGFENLRIYFLRAFPEHQSSIPRTANTRREENSPVSLDIRVIAADSSKAVMLKSTVLA